jgi:tryptophan-rich sensory protein
MQQVLSYIISFAILTLVATIPSKAMRSIQTPWYQCVKSKLTPPNYVFPIVWTTLYALLAITLAQVFNAPQSNNKTILLALFAINLALNPIWSFAYFQYKMPYISLGILLALIGTTLAILYYTYKTLPLWISILIIPYYLWLSFALLLSTVSLNANC